MKNKEKEMEKEQRLINEWLKTNKPKKVGLDISIEEYSKQVTKTMDLKVVSPYLD